VAERLVVFKLVVLAFRAWKKVANRLVEVVFVPVAFVQIRLVVSSVPVTVVLPKREVKAVRYDAYRLVVVVFVPVAFTQVMLVGLKFEATRFVKVPVE
jgi:hypothetical protein